MDTLNMTKVPERIIICECGKEITLELIGGQYQNSYINNCVCGRKWILEDLSENLETEYPKHK